MDISVERTPKTKLTDIKCKNAKTSGKLSDGKVEGLYLHVVVGKTKVGRHWRLKYRLNGKEGLYSIGSYPEISLDDAREAARAARKLIKQGESPISVKRAQIAAQKVAADNTFEVVAKLWLASKEKGKTALVKDTLDGYRSALGYAYRAFGNTPIAAVTLVVITDLEESIKASSMAPKVRDRIRDVLDYALRKGMIERNVAVAKRVATHSTEPRPALEDAESLRLYLEKLNAIDFRSYGLREALGLLVLLPVRPVELVTMRWSDVDLETGTWVYVVSKTKRRTTKPHTVPLPRQAVEVLQRMRLDSFRARLDQKSAAWVFPSPRLNGSHRTRDTLLAAMVDDKNGLGYKRGELSAHGFRSTFRSLAHDPLGGDPIIMELMLSHTMPGAMGATYARAPLLDQRRDLAQLWADYVDGLKTGKSTEIGG